MAAALKPGDLRKMRHANRKFPQNSEKFQFLMLFSPQSRVGPNHSNLRPVPADRFYYRFSIYDGTRYKLVHPMLCNPGTEKLMLARHVKRCSFLVLLCLIFLLRVETADACSCGGKPTVLNSFNASDVVVIAKAVSVEKAEPEKTAAPGRVSEGGTYVHGIKSTSMIVEQAFKGTLKVGDEMIFIQGGGANCIWTFHEEDIGKKFLFYLRRFEKSPHWIAMSCGRSTPVEYAADDLLYLTILDKVRNKTRISGTLSFDYEAGESIAGRKIRIVGPKLTQEVKTDDNGVYEIYDLPAGRYFIEPEIPKGWKVAQSWLPYSPSLDRNAKDGTPQKIPIILEANKHAGLDITFEIDNAVRGHVYDPLGQPMKGVCLDLASADGTKGASVGDCTENDGSFEIHKIPPGDYVLRVNQDGFMTSSEPFGTLYYPKTTKREEATVFNIALGDMIENLEIYPPIELKTITVEGIFLFSDGKPVAGESVHFASVKKKSAENDEDDDDLNEASVDTDSKGRFSIKIVQGANGILYGWMYSYVGEFENCPKLDRLIKKSDTDVPEIRTQVVPIRATSNLYGVELKFPFPSCKKAEKPNK